MDKKELFSRITSGTASAAKSVAKNASGKAKSVDLYGVSKALGRYPLKGMYSIDVTGLENIPETGPVIIAANHRSFMDSIFLPHVLPRKITFVAKAEYFESIKTRWFFNATGQIPVKRDSGGSGAGALMAAKEVLERGEMFAIYPEGTRTRDGFLHRGHTGVARLALDTHATLIPCGLVGTEHVQSTDEKIPRPGKKIEVHFGEPINVEKYLSHSDSRLAQRYLTDELMYEIFSLCHYGYVDTYANALRA